MAALILSGANRLATAPEIGRPMGDGTGRRELILPFGKGGYVLRYIVEQPATAVIIRVWHDREGRSSQGGVKTSE
jgi:plasmid stabilization system protein ParE